MMRVLHTTVLWVSVMIHHWLVVSVMIHHWSIVSVMIHHWSVVSVIICHWSFVSVMIHHWSIVSAMIHYWSVVSVMIHHWSVVSIMIHYWSAVSVMIHYWSVVSSITHSGVYLYTSANLWVRLCPPFHCLVFCRSGDAWTDQWSVCVARWTPHGSEWHGTPVHCPHHSSSQSKTKSPFCPYYGAPKLHTSYVWD